MKGLTGRSARDAEKRAERQQAAQLRIVEEEKRRKKKKLSGERVRALRGRSQRTLFDVLDSETSGSSTQGRSSLLG